MNIQVTKGYLTATNKKHIKAIFEAVNYCDIFDKTKQPIKANRTLYWFQYGINDDLLITIGQKYTNTIGDIAKLHYSSHSIKFPLNIGDTVSYKFIAVDGSLQCGKCAISDIYKPALPGFDIIELSNGIKLPKKSSN